MITSAISPACATTLARRFEDRHAHEVEETLAVEEPLEIRIVYGDTSHRTTKSISVTMRTPGNDASLATGFLLTEGVIRDANDIDSIATSETDLNNQTHRKTDGTDSIVHAGDEKPNVVTVELAPGVEINTATLERNFYTTSSCGVCGKASLLALRAVCPPRVKDDFAISPDTLCALPDRLCAAQGLFQQTGGLHAAALFTCEGSLDSMHEDVGRHNALDKLIGSALLADQLPLRTYLLMLSGRTSFELVQKAVMAGIPMIASVGAPSSLAVRVAAEFGVTLAGFLRDNHFNVYHGAHRIRA